MQPIASPETDRTVGIEPPVRHIVPWRVVDVKAAQGACLRVTFVDGTAGEVEMTDFLANETVTGTVFEPLRDPVVFAQVRVVSGAVKWNAGPDLAPDAMYDEIKRTGRWVVP